MGGGVEGRRSRVVGRGVEGVIKVTVILDTIDC